MIWTAAITLLSAAAFGTVDFLGGVASKRDAALLVTAGSHLVAAVVVAVSLVFMAPDRSLNSTELGLSLFSGLASGFGVLALYAGFAQGKMGFVSAIAAAVSGGAPALFDLARGTTVGPVTLVGLGLAVLAAVLVSLSGEEDVEGANAKTAALFAVVSGVCFAVGILAFDALSSAASGLSGSVGSLPVLWARVASAVVLGALAAVRYRRVTVSRSAAAATLGAGLFDSVANVALLQAIMLGPLVLVSPIQALYPIPTILLARVFLKERLHGLQLAGMAVALVALLLTAIPG